MTPGPEEGNEDASPDDAYPKAQRKEKGGRGLARQSHGRGRGGNQKCRRKKNPDGQGARGRGQGQDEKKEYGKQPYGHAMRPGRFRVHRRKEEGAEDCGKAGKHDRSERRKAGGCRRVGR